MLIDCDTCTARGTGCADCVVTVLLGAPPGWQGVDPVVVPMSGRRARPAFPRATSDAHSGATAEDVVVPPAGVVVEFDDVERRAVRALADVGLVPPLRHRGAAGNGRSRGPADRLTGADGPVRFRSHSGNSAPLTSADARERDLRHTCPRALRLSRQHHGRRVVAVRPSGRRPLKGGLGRAPPNRSTTPRGRRTVNRGPTAVLG